MRAIVNAILCQSRTGCQWDYLPPRSAAYYYFAKWLPNGSKDQAAHSKVTQISPYVRLDPRSSRRSQPRRMAVPALVHRPVMGTSAAAVSRSLPSPGGIGAAKG